MEENQYETNSGDGIESPRSSWSFRGISEVFDSHIQKSVPFYKESHDLICNYIDFFAHENSSIYDIGCSTGTLTNKINRKWKRNENI